MANQKPDNRAKSNKPCPVVCIETGTLYASGEAAAQALGAPNGANIRTAARKGKTSRGYHWRFATDRETEAGEVLEAAHVAEEPANDSADSRQKVKRKYTKNLDSDNKARAVVCVETGEIYASGEAAAQALGAPNGANIRTAARKGKTSRGYHWRFATASEAASVAPPPRPAKEPEKPKEAKKPRGVVCWETGEAFESTRTAADALGISSTSMITNAIRSKGRTGGLHWYWANEPRPESFPEPKPRKHAGGRRKRPVICWETGELFDSAKEAAAAYGVAVSGISEAVARRGRCHGLHWYWADEPRPESFPEPKRPTGRPKRGVVCVETGEEYPSIKEAAAAVGLRSPASLSCALKNGGTAAGYHWRYIDV